MKNEKEGLKDINGITYPEHWCEEVASEWPDLREDVYCVNFGEPDFSMGFTRDQNEIFRYKIKLEKLLSWASGEGWVIWDHGGGNLGKD